MPRLAAGAVSGVDPREQDELRQLLEAALARYGAAGGLSIIDQHVTLTGSGRAVSTDISHLSPRWGALSFEERKREAQALARQLVSLRRSCAPETPKRSRSPVALFSAGFLALAAAVALVRLPWSDLQERFGGSAPAVTARVPEPNDLDRERAERAERVCAATLSRVLRGASVGPTDAEGWVVEISWLWDAGVKTRPSLHDFVDFAAGAEQGRLVWTGSQKLAAAQGVTTRATSRESALPQGSPTLVLQTLTLFGEYALAYFRERDRIEFIRLGHALAKHFDARLGGLFARCAGQQSHQLGAWFAGEKPGSAAAALLHFMGVYALPPHIHRRYLSAQADGELDPTFALGSLLEASKGLGRKEIAGLISGQDGMIAEADGLTSIRFPFVNPSSATRASVSLARNLKLYSEQD
jgi:hypothetical protein